MIFHLTRTSQTTNAKLSRGWSGLVSVVRLKILYVTYVVCMYQPLLPKPLPNSHSRISISIHDNIVYLLASKALRITPA